MIIEFGQILSAFMVVITYQTFFKLINGLWFLDQTTCMNVDFKSMQGPVLPAHCYIEGFAFGSWINVVSCVRLVCALISTLVYEVQKTRVKSFQIRSRFWLPLCALALSSVFALQFLARCFRVVKRNVSIIFSFGIGICLSDTVAIIRNENCSQMHSPYWSDIPYSNQDLLM